MNGWMERAHGCFLCHDEQQTTQGRKDRQKGTTTKDMRTTAITTTSKPRRGASADFKARQPRICWAHCCCGWLLAGGIWGYCCWGYRTTTICSTHKMLEWSKEFKTCVNLSNVPASSSCVAVSILICDVHPNSPCPYISYFLF